MLQAPAGCPINLTQFWHYLSRMASESMTVLFHRTAPFNFRIPVASPGWYLCFRLTGYRLKVLMTSPSGSITVLEQLTELKEACYLLDHQFIMKGDDKGCRRTSRWKLCRGQSMGKGYQGFYASAGTLLSQCLLVVTNLEALWILSFWVLIELDYISIIH